MSAYRNAHNAVRRRFGPARHYACVWCGGYAEQWAYAYSAKDEQKEPNTGPYSLDPRNYQPMCRRDHMTLDNLVRRKAPTRHFVNAVIAAYKRRPMLLKMMTQLEQAATRRAHAIATGREFECWERRG